MSPSVARQLDSRAESMFEGHAISRVELERARYLRFDADIQLMRARGSGSRR